MKDPSKTHPELIIEISALKQKIQELEQSVSECRRTSEALRESRNVTEYKRVEEENKAYIRFLESLERVDRAIKQETNVEQMLSHIIRTVFAIFDCDRAWLFYPCDPDAPTFRVPMEMCRPEYPGAMVLNVDVPMPPDMALNLREALESDDPVTYTAGTGKPINRVSAEQFGVQSMMMAALYPKLGKPWAFGMHQCSHPRIWTEEEKKLFTEIGRRISDGLSSVLFLRELQENEERFRATFEQAAVGIAHVAPDGRWMRVNQTFCDIVGYSREELLQKTFQDITHPDDLDADLEYVRKVLAAEIQTYHREKRYIRKDGSIVWIDMSVSIVHHASGEPGYFISVIEDITKRKRAEEALRESEERHRRIVEALSDAVLLRSNEIVIYANPAALKLFRADHPEDLIGKRYLDLVYPEDRAMSAARVEKNIYENWIASPREHRILALDGQVVHVESTGVPVKYRGETQVFGVFRDITERKRVEEERQSLVGRLQRAEKMEALGQLAGGVAHDLNNVLGILSGYSELLIEEIPEGHRSRGHAEQILRSTEKGAAIIQDLLTLARRGVATSDVINLNNVVSDFLKTPVFEKTKDHHPRVTFRTECDKNLLNIKGSPVHLEKTLMNLVSNAVESIPGEGAVTIRTESRYLDKAIRGYDEVKEGDYAVLTVSDTGIGIPAENREKIFEPFYTKKTMGRSGTGLGLAIVWGTVKDHNAYIDLQTEVGQGTTFTLYFPVTREERTAYPQKVPIERYMGKGESVLIIDDIAGQRDVASKLLTRLGYEVHLVSSGEAAVEYLRKNQLDILVLDMIMAPGIDGLETYQRVLEINPKQKAILVSGFSETERVREAQKLGAGAYVKKPYVMEKIGVAIRDELDRK
jgi:PAS domain S-box-containing protein